MTVYDENRKSISSNFRGHVPNDRKCQSVNMVSEEAELELGAAEEVALLLKYGSDITPEDFKDLGMISEDTIYLVKVERIYYGKKRSYLGVIDKSYDCFALEGRVDFALRYSRLNPRYKGLDLKMVLDRMEQTKCKSDIGFKVTDLVKIN